jgi:hypothetical protein
MVIGCRLTRSSLLFRVAVLLILFSPLAATNGAIDAAESGPAAHSVLLLGGRGTMGSEKLTSGDLYDASTQTFTAIPNIAPNRLRYSAIRLDDARILFLGGFDRQGQSKEALFLDPAGKSLKRAPYMQCGHGFHSTTRLKDGRVLIAGGSISDDLNSDCAEIYDPSTNRFQRTAGKLNFSRFRHTATLMPDGKVLIAGGAHTAGGLNHALNSAETFDPATGRFTLTRARLHAKRDDLSAVPLNNGKVLIAGGYDDNVNLIHTVEVFDPAGGTFKVVKGRVPISVSMRFCSRTTRFCSPEMRNAS